MTVKYNQNLGVFQIDGRGAYATRAEAEAAEGSQQQANVVDDDDFAANFDGASSVLAPQRDPSTVITPAQATRSNELFGQGYTDLNRDGKVDDEDVRLSGVPYGTPLTKGGTATGFQVQQTALGDRDAKPYNGHPTVANYVVTGLPGEGAEGFRGSYSYTTTPGGGGTKVSGAVGSYPTGSGPGASTPMDAGSVQQYQNAATETQAAGDQFQNEQKQNGAESRNLFSDAMARYDALGGGDYLASDQARAYQQEGLQQQRMLLEKLLGFDEDQYAAQFGDQALARTIAAGRQGTSAAAQQAGTFAAMEQAPALYAEGRRQASELANQRLGLAETAAKSFGELGTMTRGQDETRAQFEAKLPLEIANSVAALTQGKLSLNQQESEMFANIWMDFARLQSVYAGMSSEEQMAWWQNETARRGQDKTFDAIKAQIKANGAVSDKDILNGLFQLGGGLLGLGGRLGAA
jgi:hypothetical protein